MASDSGPTLDTRIGDVARKRARLSQKQLAAKLRKQAWVSNTENGRVPASSSYVEKVLKACKPLIVKGSR